MGAHENWDGLVVVGGASSWGGTPLMEQHLARELARRHPVLYVDPPTSVLSRWRDRAAPAAPAGLRRIAPGFAVLSVRLPPLKDRAWAKPVSLPLLRRALRHAVVRLRRPRVAAVVATSLDNILGALGEERSVYLAKDDYTAGASLLGMNAAAVERYVAALCSAADTVVAVSPTLAQTLSARGVDPVVIPNGCDPEEFAGSGVPGVDLEPVAAFLGHLSDRVDVTLLEAVADRGIRLRIIGPEQATLTAGHFDGLRSRGGVEWRGSVAHRDLPAALADVTTGLLPYRDTAFNRASFPLKALEYLAAGRRVISTDLPALAWLDTDLITTAAPTAFAGAVATSLATPLIEAEVERRRGFARGHTWARRADALEAAIGLSPDARGASPSTVHR